MPLVSVMIACVCNIAGDLLLVAVFHMGTAGAAIATVAAQAVSVAITLWIILKRGLPFTMRKEYIRLRSGETGRILKLGIPVALQDVLVSISFLVLMAIVNAMGVIASAGVGVAEKLCGFIMLVPSAFMQSISVFVAQNIGAVQPQRARRTLGYGMLMSILAGLIMAYAAFFHGDALSAIFARDTEIIQASAQYLKAYAVDTILTSFLFCFIGYFNGCGRTWFIMLQGIVGAFLVRIPVAYAISKIRGVTLFMIGLATPSSSLVQILLCLIYYLILWKAEKKH